MEQKRLTIGFMLLLVVCMLCFVPAIAETTSTKINTSDFSDQSSLYFYDDGSWVYSGSCMISDSNYIVNVAITCWGKDVLTCYPQMTVAIGEKRKDSIVAHRLTIEVAGNSYEYELIEGYPPWNADIRVGNTYLLPSDSNLIKDLASVRECILVAETDNNVYTWKIPEKYYNYFLPFVQDMLKYDFLNNIEENETNEIILKYSPARIAYKNVGSGSAVYDSGPDPEEGYSFCEDSDAINQAKKSVFYVEMYDENKNCLGNASGFVSFDEHFFVTNEHVIDGASYLIIWDNNDRSYILDEVVALDKDHDFAILKFAEGVKYTSLKLDTNDNLKRGMPVVAIGSKGLQVASSMGIISAFPVLEQYAGVKCIQYSAPTSRESNGGCLLGDNGKVIGITSAISSEGQYIGAAVPVRYLIDLYLKLKSNVNNVMNTSGSSNTDTLKENGKKKEDYTIITGGKINTIVAIPDDFDLDPYIMHTMNMTVQEFLNKYDEVRKTVVTDAPAITNKTIIAFNTSYCINCDVDNGVGTRVYCMFEKNQDPNNLDIPVTAILQFYKTSPHGTIVKLNASTRACLAVFSDDMFLLDKLIDFYGKNNCRSNDCYSGVITSEGYLITYSNSNGIDATISIYNVMR